MLGLDHLQQLVSYLDKQTKSLTAPGAERTQLDALETYLRAIYDSKTYQAWLELDQYAGAMSYVGKPDVPVEAASKHPQSKRILDQFLLCANGKLEVKVDLHKATERKPRVHITDGYWVPETLRVYPTADESEILCEYIREQGYHALPGLTLIDPACGCGHHALGLSEIPRRVSMDISLRALTFARFNAILARDENHLLCVNDIQDGLPNMVVDFASGPILFCVNMPFAIMPDGMRSSSKAQDGGERGTEMTLAAVTAIADFAKRNTTARPIRAVVLAYSLRRAKGRTVEQEVVLRAREKFAEHDVAAHIKWIRLEEQTLWRVNGKKEQPNPMPVANMETKASCWHTFRPMQMPAAREDYRRKAKQFLDEGWTELEYGIIDIEISTPHHASSAKTKVKAKIKSEDGA